MEGEFFSEDSDSFYTADDASVGKSSVCSSVGESSAWDVQDSLEQVSSIPPRYQPAVEASERDDYDAQWVSG